MTSPAGRKFQPPFSELIDRLTVDQIKEVLLPESRESYADEIQQLQHDLDLLIEEKGLKLNAELIRIIVILAQMNVHIWHNKDEMQRDPDRYDELLKLAHQLNGIRNQMKNRLLGAAGHEAAASRHTNVETDDLKGWDLSI